MFRLGITELEHFLLSRGDGAVSILSFAENTCDEGRRKEVRSARNEAARRSGGDWTLLPALQEKQDRNHRELHDAIEYLNAKRSMRLETMERKQKWMNGASNEIQKKVLRIVLVLADKILELENELHEAREDMRKLTVERKKADAAPIGLRCVVASSSFTLPQCSDFQILFRLLERFCFDLLPIVLHFCMQFLDINPGLFIPFGQLARVFRRCACFCLPNSATSETFSASSRVLGVFF